MHMYIIYTCESVVCLCVYEYIHTQHFFLKKKNPAVFQLHVCVCVCVCVCTCVSVCLCVCVYDIARRWREMYKSFSEISKIND